MYGLDVGLSLLGAAKLLRGRGVRSKGAPEVMNLGKQESKASVSPCIPAPSFPGHDVLLFISADICNGDKKDSVTSVLCGR